MNGWTRTDMIAALATVVSACSAILSFIGVRMAKNIHIMINSRMGQMIAGAHAEGGMEERKRADERNRVQDTDRDRNHPGV
jgi:hypothetical protein